MISNEKIMLLESWENNLFGEFSISEIMKISKKKTKPWVFNSLRHLVKSGLLISKEKAMLIYQFKFKQSLLIQMFAVFRNAKI